MSPIVLRQSSGPRVAFISYYKGVNALSVISSDKPVAVVASDDFGGPGQTFDFTAPISHTLLRDNIRKKGAFEKMRLAGRPPVAVGVSSGGDLYGNTQITFTDVLGDKEVSFYAQSELQYRTTALTYTNTGRRFQYALQGFSQDQFLFGTSSQLYDPALSPYITRDLAEAVQTQRGGTVFGIYPFNRYTRVELSSGLLYLSERYNDEYLQAQAEAYQVANYGTSAFRNGYMMPFGVSLVNETTVFREYGPVAGSTYKLSYNGSPSFGTNWLSRNTVEADARHYTRIAANGVLALRLNAQKSVGTSPDLYAYGGNSEMRGYEYLEFLGQRGFFANAELRFPLIEAMLTPIGVLGGLRGVFFANLGGSSFNTQSFNFGSMRSGTADAIVGYDLDAQGNIIKTRTQTYNINGIRLIDARASYGLGLQSFMFGFPMHFDFSWKTLLNKDYEDIIFRSCALTSAQNAECVPAGSEFRKMKFSFWIGYDF